MRTKVAIAVHPSQPASADQRDIVRSANADLEEWLSRLQQAMRDTGWTPDALAVQWGVDRGYVWKLLNGEKPWSVGRKLSLPDDIEARLAFLEAKHFGFVVVEPLTGAAAQSAFVAGLLGMFSGHQHPLPDRAGEPLKVDLVADMQKARRA